MKPFVSAADPPVIRFSEQGFILVEGLTEWVKTLTPGVGTFCEDTKTGERYIVQFAGIGKKPRQSPQKR